MSSTIPIASTLMSGVAGFVGNNKQGSYEKGIADRNSQMARMQEADAIARGVEQERKFRINLRKLTGKQRAAFAGQGVALDSGSPVDVIGDTAALGELDALMIRANAQREAWGFANQANDFTARGELAKRAGQNRGFDTLLTSSARAWEMYNKGTAGKLAAQGAPEYGPMGPLPQE